MMNYNLLYAEDDHDMADLNINYLKKRGYNVLYADNGEDAWQMYEKLNPDILLLDIVMPRMNGLELAKKIRMRDKQTPILFMSALSGTDDVVRGFAIGANDYVRKDAEPEEMEVRIAQALKAYPKLQGDVYITKNTHLNTANRSIISFGVEEKLPMREYNFIYFMTAHANVQHSRKFVIANIWGDSPINGMDYLSKAICLLRHKLEKDPDVQLITYRSSGIILQVSESESHEPPLHSK